MTIWLEKVFDEKELRDRPFANFSTSFPQATIRYKAYRISI
jgi:hypothetical protein